MLRAVIDTSCLVSYALTRDKLMRQVIAQWQDGTFTVLSLPATRAELAGVLARPAIQQVTVVPLDEILETIPLAPETVARVHEALALLGPGTR